MGLSGLYRWLNSSEVEKGLMLSNLIQAASINTGSFLPVVSVSKMMVLMIFLS
jgi:hypothetical protein